MNNKRYKNMEIVKTIELVVELVVLTVVFYFLYMKMYDQSSFPSHLGKDKYTLQTVYAATMCIIISMNDGFKFEHTKLSHVIITQCSSVAICNIITYFYMVLIANEPVSLLPMLLITILEYLTCILFCYFFTVIHHKLLTSENIIMLIDKNSKYVHENINVIKRNNNVTEMVYNDKSFQKLLDKIAEYDAVMIGDLPEKRRNDIIKLCYENNKTAYIAPSINDIFVKHAKVITISDTPYFVIKNQVLTHKQALLKRIMDIVLCLFALIFALPITIIITIAIKLEDGGPVIFKQKRVTKDFKVFEIYKFRSMVVEKEDLSSTAITKDKDAANLKVTKVGRVIRGFRLDELPQIYNILVGDMSIVGPRPEMIEEVEQHCKELPEFKYRYKVKAGLTGYAQVYGRHSTSSHNKIRLDLLYIENYSLLMDIKIIIDTVRILFDKESNE